MYYDMYILGAIRMGRREELAEQAEARCAELRWHVIGSAQIEREVSAVLLVVHAYREDKDGEEIIRIISARAAEKHETRRYQEQAMD
jgi:uncharacterized DUF497 family protein